MPANKFLVWKLLHSSNTQVIKAINCQYQCVKLTAATVCYIQRRREFDFLFILFYLDSQFSIEEVVCMQIICYYITIKPFEVHMLVRTHLFHFHLSSFENCLIYQDTVFY